MKIHSILRTQILRLSYNMEHRELAIALLRKMQNYQFSLFSYTHIALFASEFRIHHRTFMDKLVKNSLANLKQARLKDWSAICYTIVRLNYTASDNCEQDYLQAVSNELLNRETECMQYRQSFIACMCHLAMRNVFHPSLLAKALTITPNDDGPHAPAFHMNGLLFLDSYARMNAGDIYKGPLLTAAKRVDMEKRFYEPVDRSLLVDIQNVIAELFAYSRLARALPHFKRDGELQIFLLSHSDQHCFIFVLQIFM